MKQLIEDIAKALVDIPEEVSVHLVEGEQVTVLELKVAPSDLGKVIGKQGRTARSIRTILGAAGMKSNRRFTLEILEPSVPQSDGAWVTIALLGKARGNRGELTAIPLSSKPERYESLTEVYLFGSGQRHEVETTWFHNGTLIFKFRGIDSISDAQTLTGSEVRVPFAERTQLDEGEFFQSDLIGCEVFDQGTGERLGEVTNWEDGGGSGILVVDRHLMIPFVRAICVEINPAGRRIAVELPPGLKDLYQP